MTNKTYKTTNDQTNNYSKSTLNYIDSLEKVSDILYAKFPDTSFILSGNTSCGKKNITLYWHDSVSIKDVMDALSVFPPNSKVYLDSNNDITSLENESPITFDVNDIIIQKSFSKCSAEKIKHDIVKTENISSDEVVIVPGSEDKIGYTFSVKMKEKIEFSNKSLSNIKDFKKEYVSDLIIERMFNFSS